MLVEDYVLKMLRIASEMLLVEFRKKALSEREMERYISALA